MIANAEVISLKGRHVLHLDDGGRVFAKISSGSAIAGPEARKMAHERTCLEVLAGLAVPRLVELREAQLPAAYRGVETVWLAQSYEGVYIDALPFARGELIAAWLFVVEQLVAFRRHQLLYTDVKCTNVVCRRDPTRIVIVDFDHALPLVGAIDWSRAGFTPDFEAPERVTGRLSERSLVFTLGMFLFHIVTRRDGFALRREPRLLASAARMLVRTGAPELSGLLRDCLASDPARRPADYEAVLERAAATRLPREIRAGWRALRAPYRKRLAQVGL